MSLQVIVLILLSVMLLIKVCYLLFIRRTPNQEHPNQVAKHRAHKHESHHQH